MPLHLPTAMSVAKKSLVVAGLPVTVYSERASTEKTGPVAVLFFLHGRTGSAKSIEWVAQDAIKHIEQKKKHGKEALDLVVVTFVSIGPASVCQYKKHADSRSIGSTEPWWKASR